jgi:hypothetical protein
MEGRKRQGQLAEIHFFKTISLQTARLTAATSIAV